MMTLPDRAMRPPLPRHHRRLALGAYSGLMKRRPARAAEMASFAELGVLFDEGVDARIDLFAPTAAVEDAVMADAVLQVVFLLARRQAGQQARGGRGLADGADIVILAFDQEDGRLFDRLRLDQARARD